ncbi:hypothetical protein Tco_1074790, partial [Tanacetum coccineum]
MQRMVGHYAKNCTVKPILERDATYLQNQLLIASKRKKLQGSNSKRRTLIDGCTATEVMEFESAQSNTTAKLPILKLGEYEMWVIRIKQYFQVQDYALWEVIENGNSWVSVPQTTQENGTFVTKMSIPVTAEEKTNKKNDVKARSLLLMALPNEHQLTFSQYSDAKTMFVAIETRFGVSTVSPNINTACPQVSTANFSDNTVYAFMVENPNGSNLLQQDLEQIHEDDLEAMDLKWQLSLLSMRAKRWDTLPGNVEHQGTKRVSSDIKTTLGSNETMKTHLQRQWYNVVPPPHPLIDNRPKNLDLSYSGLDEFKDPEFKSYGFEDS